MKTRVRSTALCLFLSGLSAAAAQAACPTNPFFIDLKTGFSSAIAPAAQVSFKLPLANSPVAGCGGWKDAVLKINLKDCTQANIVVEFEGVPKLWTVNLGDSPTNDGFAGDSGTTPNDAELWIVGEDLSVANGGDVPGTVNNPIAAQDLSLNNGALKFVVKNQFVSWSQPHTFVSTPATKQIFAIPDTAAGTGDPGAFIYLGLNQVINGRADRKGCGARRALITLQ